jgi:predicted transport protein
MACHCIKQLFCRGDRPAARRRNEGRRLSATARPLFEALRKKVQALDTDIIELAEKKSVSYHGPAFFLEVLPRKNRIGLLLPLEFNEVDDSEGTLSDQKNDPSNGIVHVNEPLGTALLGAEEGDEIEVLVGSIIRPAVIERVENTGAKTADKRPQPPLGLVFPQHRETSTGATEPPLYKAEKLDTEDRNTFDPAKFYETDYRHIIQKLGVDNIDRLGPITFKHLSDIIARAHGFQRTGSEIKRQIWSAISRSRKSSRAPNGHVVFWPSDMSPMESFEFRGLAVKGDIRAWSDVPYPEQLSLAIAVLRSGSLQDPAAAIGAKIGLSRLREATRDELEKLVAAARETTVKGLERDR